MARFAMISEERGFADDGDSEVRDQKPGKKATSFSEHNEWALRMWRRMDRDHSESITRHELDCEEFRAALRSAMLPNAKAGSMCGGAQYERSEINIDQAIEFCLRKADLNSDGTLTFEEFSSFTFCLRTEGMAKQTATLIFALFDLDGDARIDEAEFREIFRFFLGHIPKEVEFQAEWARLDTKGKQTVSRGEFLRWLQRCKDPIFQQHAPPAAGSLPAEGSRSTTDTPPRMLRRTLSGSTPKTLWNEHFNTKKNINEDACVSRRNYFTRPQSLPELKRHFDSHKGFGTNKKKLITPEPAVPVRVLSTDTGRCFAFQPQMGLPGGTMRSHMTGEVKQWEDHWQTPQCVRRKVRPGSLDFRCPPQPAKWMFAGAGETL